MTHCTEPSSTGAGCNQINDATLFAPIEDVKCEQLLISTMLQFSSSLPVALEILDTGCFRDTRHADIFRAITEVYAKGDNPDFITVPAHLASEGSGISQTDILGYLDMPSVVGDVTPYALRLKTLALRRKLNTAGLVMASQSHDESIGVESVHASAKAAIDSLFDKVGNRFKTIGEVYAEELQKQMVLNHDMNGNAIYGTPTGFREIDRRGGLTGGTLTILGAETSMGKTSFANALALSSVKAGHGIAYYSMEMTPKELNARFLAMMTGIQAGRILFGQLDWAEIRSCDDAMQTFDTSLLRFDDSSTNTIDSVMMSVRSMKAKHDIKGVVVDYLQLVNAGDRSLNREQSVAKIARDLKNLAKELDIWVVALSQLTRDKNNPVPTMSRLRDSGQIEEAADNVYLLYRIPKDQGRYPEPFSDIDTEGTAMVIIGKGRNTGTGQFICSFNPETTLFSDDDPKKRIQVGFPKRATDPIDPF